MVAAAIIGSGVLSAGTSLLGSSTAASASEDAANKSLQAYYQTRSDLSPYVSAGTNVLTDLTSLAKSGPTGGGPDYVTQAYQNLPASSGAMTQAELEKTPGYQFTLGQGLKATQSANAAKGLGISGAALKGAAKYATGLADSTYSNRFNEAQQTFKDYLDLSTGQQNQLTNQYTRLQGTAALGENAAAQTGTAATNAANTYGQYTSQAGTQTGSGYVNASNALTSGVQNYLSYDQLDKMINKNSGSSGTSYAPAISSTATDYLGTGWKGSAAA